MRRTPMPPRTRPLPRTRLARGTGPATWDPAAVMPRSTLGPGRDTGPDEATRAAVYARDGGRCVCCGTPVKNRPHSIGHRVGRAHGTDNSLPNLVTFLGWGNGLTGDDDHHYRIDRRHLPADETNGYSLRSWQVPALVPVLLYGGLGQRLWLTVDGHYSAAPPAGRGNR